MTTSQDNPLAFAKITLDLSPKQTNILSLKGKNNMSKYVEQLESRVNLLEKSNEVMRQFLTSVSKDINSGDDTIKRILVQLVSRDMILNWLDGNKYWGLDSTTQDARFSKKIYVTKESGGNSKRISVITKIESTSTKELENEFSTSVFEAMNEVLRHADSSSNCPGKVSTIAEIILGSA